jgi:hypothetical protein
MKMTVYRVVAKHFVAGFVVEDGLIVRAAPIIKYTIGWKERRALKYFFDKHFLVREIDHGKSD